MRKKKAAINAIVNIGSYVLLLPPVFFIRKLFLNTLGEELLGINYLFLNIVGLLSLVELGMGSAIMYALFDPIAKQNMNKIASYMKLYKKAYRLFALLILGLGALLIPFLPQFIKGEIDTFQAVIIFLIFVLNSAVSYLFSYKITLLEASQEGYRNTTVFFITRLVLYLFQIAGLYLYPNIFLFLGIQFVVDFLYFNSINWVVKKRYPALTKASDEELSKEEVEKVVRNVKAAFLHKVGMKIVLGTDNILISKFFGLAQVARFNNYNMILKLLDTLSEKLFSGFTAGIGNLLATESKDDSYALHNRMQYMNFLIASVVIVTLYSTVDQFIGIWLGKEYLLQSLTIAVLLINLYIKIMRTSVEHFQTGSGTFYNDRYAPVAESIINIGASLLLLKKFGIAGVFMGTLVSNLAVIFWVKPLVVYKHVFQKSVWLYFLRYFKFVVVIALMLTAVHYGMKPVRAIDSLGGFIGNVAGSISIVLLLNTLFFFRSDEGRYLFELGHSMLRKRGE